MSNDPNNYSVKVFPYLFIYLEMYFRFSYMWIPALPVVNKNREREEGEVETTTIQSVVDEGKSNEVELNEKKSIELKVLS